MFFLNKYNIFLGHSWNCWTTRRQRQPWAKGILIKVLLLFNNNKLICHFKKTLCIKGPKGAKGQAGDIGQTGIHGDPVSPLYFFITSYVCISL